MDDATSRAWLEAKDVPRGTFDLLDRLADLVRAEGERQNLVAASTLPTLWARHIVDSAQLLDLADNCGDWIDIGTGAGFPGLVVAILRPGAMICVEPRARRAAFLRHAVQELGLADRVEIVQAKAESMIGRAPGAVISARAVAPLIDLLVAARHLASPETSWLLPKGRSANAELAEAARAWQGDFRLVPSITEPTASIVVARNVRRRTGR